MKHFYILIICTIVMFCSSCNRNEKDISNEDIISIDIDNLEEGIKRRHLSNFAKNCRLVPLECNKECIIGKIDYIKVINDTIYILDAHSTKTLFLFSLEGNYLSKISRIGKGPGEYLYPICFDIDPIKHEIMIYDLASSKIIVYNKKGQYLKSIKIKNRITSFIYNNSHFYLYYDPNDAINNKILHKINSSGRTIWSSLNTTKFFKRNRRRSLKGGNLYKFNDGITFWRHIHPVIYSIKNETISPKFAVYTNNHRITESEAKESLVNLVKSNKLHSIQEYSENSQYSLFNFYLGRNRFYVFYDKLNNKIYYSKRFKDDLSKLPTNYYQLLQDNKMLGIVPALSVGTFNKKILKELDLDNKYNNPVIVFYDLNKSI